MAVYSLCCHVVTTVLSRVFTVLSRGYHVCYVGELGTCPVPANLLSKIKVGTGY